MSEWDKIDTSSPWTIPPTPRDQRIDGNSRPDNMLHKKPQPRALADDELEEAEFSLTGIAPEAAEQLLLLPLMHDVPDSRPDQLGLSELKHALEKIRNREYTTPIDDLALELASEIIHGTLHEGNATGAAAYLESGLHQLVNEFIAVAMRYATLRRPLRA